MAAGRDPRAANAMDAESRNIHRRLEAWGRWSREAANASRQTPIAKMMELGLIGAGSDSAPVSMPEAIEETDDAVSALPDLEQRAVRRYYLHWEAVGVTARMLKVSVRDLQRILHRARWRIAIILFERARKQT